ncbi:MAG: GGDEF domain-containing protein [Lachnospiraceae bacterium]|nr:GGDEF domain-containing protein [Lachnospiraceae bacterium]
MKQFNLTYENDEKFLKKLEEIKQWYESNTAYTMVFRIYSMDMEKSHIAHICDLLDKNVPDALYLGCTTNGNIMDGAFIESEIMLTCTIFEDESTKVKLLQYPFTDDNYKDAVDNLKKNIEENPWVTSVEMHAGILGMSMQGYCDEMSTLREDIQIFGGGAFAPNLDSSVSYVFSKGNDITQHGIIFLMLGGENFHVYSTYLDGWKPLKRRFRITKADKAVLHELDGIPAFEVYRRYLNIEKNDNFFSNTLEFPLFLEQKGVNILRCPFTANDDNSLTMSSDMEEDAYVRIAYGDPDQILNSIREDGQKVADFQPEVIEAFTCSARRAFWGDFNVSKETVMFKDVATTTGLYTSGEFLRINGNLFNLNVTLVIVAMREGDPVGEKIDFLGPSFNKLDKIPMIWRFVSFIEASTAELEAMNQKLSLAAITDGLTRLYNRAEIERRIHKALEKIEDEPGNDKVHLIMLDIDNFKKVNDVYGHKEGDDVIIALSDILRQTAADIPNASAGRWGGEEFMLLLEGNNTDEAMAAAEKIREAFAAVDFKISGQHTASVGVTQVITGEAADKMCSRVDNALYMAKEAGKNRVVWLDS